MDINIVNKINDLLTEIIITIGGRDDELVERLYTIKKDMWALQDAEAAKNLPPL